MAELNDKSTARSQRAGDGPSLFPMFVKLAGRNCLVVGAGRIAASKIPGLLEAGARVRVVAPEANPVIEEWAASGRILWERRCFEARDLNDVFLVISATALRELNAAVFHAARERNILCNAVDDPESCDFYYGAVVRRGALQLAISTAGLSPALAQRIRGEMEKRFGPEYAAWLQELGETREQLFAQPMDPEHRRRLLHEIASHEPYSASGGTQ